MPWVKIHLSDVPHEFGLESGAATFAESIVTASNTEQLHWFIHFEGPVRVRLTFLAYSAEGGIAENALVTWGLNGNDDFQVNQAEDPNAAFEPAQFDFEVRPSEAGRQIDYYGASSGLPGAPIPESSSVLVEVWIEAEDIPPPDRKIKLRYSKDGGHNYSPWRELALPELGRYGDRVPPIRRLGVARSFTLETECTSRLVVDIMGAVISYDEVQ